MEVGLEKEVDFQSYCSKCVYAKIDETDDPCNYCLAEPSNSYSRKPMMYKDGGNNASVR